MSREEYLAECKQHARIYLDKGDVSEGITSMLSDLSKREETKLPDDSPLNMMGLLLIMNNDLDGAYRFIEGFN